MARCVLAAIVLVTGAALASTSAGARLGPVHSGCPVPFSGWDVRTASADQAAAAARVVAFDHVVEHNQGRTSRRTRANYPIVGMVYLGSGLHLSGGSALLRLATRRCGKSVAEVSWSVTFHDSESVICCLIDTRFVVHLRNRWWVY
jgi:hypothetical protein